MATDRDRRRARAGDRQGNRSQRLSGNGRRASGSPPLSVPVRPSIRETTEVLRGLGHDVDQADHLATTRAFYFLRHMLSRIDLLEARVPPELETGGILMTSHGCVDAGDPRMTIPVDTPVYGPTRPGLPSQMSSRSGPRILLAEDDDALRDLLAEVLTSDGYLVTEARDGFAAMDLLAAFLVGTESSGSPLILTDLRMPGCTGMDILTGLRSAGWRLPVILITAFSDASVRAEAAIRGATDLIEKPFPMESILSAVHQAAPLSVSP